MSRTARILLVEDDPNLGFVTKDNLEENGYEVDWAQDGKEGLDYFKSNKYDICLLDVMLPKMDGFELGENIREENKKVPILFLTAKGMLEDRVRGFELGGDDYVTKPFSIKELMLRIEVFLKRSSSIDPEDEVAEDNQFKFEELTFNYSELLLSIGDKEKILTQKEADLLKMFCLNKNSILKREEILKELWGDDDYFMGRSLDVFISRLRKYLQGSGVSITNYHGIGFKFQVK
jgi:DNA-binding response OmpR family regulator